MTRTAAYIRVSRQEQVLHGLSLDAQEARLKDHADQNGLEIVSWYRDEGVSGRKQIKNRPALQQMICDAEAGQFEHIIFIKLDRFFRSVAEYHECMKRLDKVKVTWDATDEKYDLLTSDGRFYVNIKLASAEIEADNASRRVRDVNAHKQRTGQPLTGSMPYSHKIVSDGKYKKIVVNPETRDNCLDIINYFMSTNSLFRTLHYAKQYHDFYDLKGIRRFLQHSFLVGSYRDNPAYCEPLLDQETFDRLQLMLRRNVSHKKNDYMFTGLLACPGCGRNLTGVVTPHGYKSKSGKVYTYKKYKCNYHFNQRLCDFKGFVGENNIERQLLSHLEEFINNVSDVDFVPAGSRPVDIESLQNELDRLNYMWQKGRISMEAYDTQYDELSAQIKKAQEFIPEDNSLLIKRLESIVSDGWRDVYAKLDEAHRRSFWRSFIEKIYIVKGEKNYEIRDIKFL